MRLRVRALYIELMAAAGACGTSLVGALSHDGTASIGAWIDGLTLGDQGPALHALLHWPADAHCQTP